MLGSLHDAEDALQETLLRAWRGLPGSRAEARSAPGCTGSRPTSASTRSRAGPRVLPDRLRPAERRRRDDPGEPLVESVWVEPYPDEALGLADGYAAPEARYEQREAVELAFVAALQHLPATQRAVLILREVLGFSAREVAESLDTTVASVNSALQRARKAVDERLPERSQQATLRSLGDERMRELVERYVDAWERGDVDALPCAARRGRRLLDAAVGELVARPRDDRRLREGGRGVLRRGAHACRPARTGSRRSPTMAWTPRQGASRPRRSTSSRSKGELIKEITAFVTPEIFPASASPQSCRRRGRISPETVGVVGAGQGRPYGRFTDRCITSALADRARGPVPGSAPQPPRDPARSTRARRAPSTPRS